MAAPRQRASGAQSADPPLTKPTGATRAAAIVIAMASPSSAANRAPVRLLRTMYAAHEAPAANASPRPARSTSAQDVLVIPEIRTTPTAAPRTATRSLRRWDSTVARTDELDGDGDADGYSCQRAVEEEVHQPEHRAKHANHQPVRGGPGSQSRSNRHEQNAGRDRQPQRHRPEHPDGGYQGGRQRPAELDRDDCCQDQQRSWHSPGHSCSSVGALKDRRLFTPAIVTCLEVCGAGGLPRRATNRLLVRRSQRHLAGPLGPDCARGRA